MCFGIWGTDWPQTGTKLQPARQHQTGLAASRRAHLLLLGGFDALPQALGDEAGHVQRPAGAALLDDRVHQGLQRARGGDRRGISIAETPPS